MQPGWSTDRVLFWICVLIAISQLGFGSIVPVVPLYARSFGVSQSAIGLAIASHGLARFLLSVPAGQIADRVGRRATLALGGLVTATGSLLCALAPDYLTFLGARFVLGSGAGLVLTGGQIILADISPPERRGRIMGVYSGVFAFAVGLGPIPGGVLAERFGLPVPFYIFSALALAATAVAWWRVPETRGFRPAGATPVARPSVPFMAQLRLLVARPGFLLVSLIGFANNFSRTGGLFAIIPILGKERLGLATDQIGFALGLSSIVAVTLAYPSGVLSDRFGRKAVIVPATLLNGLSYLVFPVAPSYLWFLAGFVVWSVAVGISGPAPTAYAADIAPAGMNAAAMSSFRMLSDVGYIVGPLLLGLLADLVGAGSALGLATVLLVGMGSLFALRAPETRRRASPP